MNHRPAVITLFLHSLACSLALCSALTPLFYFCCTGLVYRRPCYSISMNLLTVYFLGNMSLRGTINLFVTLLPSSMDTAVTLKTAIRARGCLSSLRSLRDQLPKKINNRAVQTDCIQHSLAPTGGSHQQQATTSNQKY